MKIDNIKEEVTHDMANLRKKNEIEIQNTMEGHSSRLRTSRRQSQNLKAPTHHVYCSTIHNSQVMETAKMPHY
jgi:hypothetical protein